MPGTPLPRNRKDGSVVYRAQWRPPGDGSDVNRRTKTFPTKRQAKDWITEQDAAHKAGSWTEPARRRHVFANVTEEWREQWVDLAPKTRDGYASLLHRHVAPEFGHRRIGAITPAELQRFVNKLIAAGLAPGTIHHVMDVVRSVLNVAVARRYIAVSPNVNVKLPSVKNRENRIYPLTHEEVGQLVAALPEHWRLPCCSTPTQACVRASYGRCAGATSASARPSSWWTRRSGGHPRLVGVGPEAAVPHRQPHHRRDQDVREAQGVGADLLARPAHRAHGAVRRRGLHLPDDNRRGGAAQPVLQARLRARRPRRVPSAHPARRGSREARGQEGGQRQPVPVPRPAPYVRGLAD